MDSQPAPPSSESRRVKWTLAACAATCGLTVLATLALSGGLDGRNDGTPAPSTPEPGPVVSDTPATNELPEPWIEEVHAQTLGGWLIDARYRYGGRYPDCWVVCEAGGFRKVVAPLAEQLAKRFWEARAEPEGESPSGRIDAVLALPVANQHCVFDVSVTHGHFNQRFFQPLPFPRRWCEGGQTLGTAFGRKSYGRGWTYRIYHHTTERQVSALESGGQWLAVLHADHEAEVLGGGSWWNTARSVVESRSNLRAPAAWTAARILGASLDGRSVLAAVVPYAEFVETYFSYARLEVYARFLSDAEVEQLRATAAAAKAAKAKNGEEQLLRLIESFRKNQTR